MTIVNETKYMGFISISAYSGATTKEEAIKEVGAYIRDNISQSEGDTIVNYPMDCITESSRGSSYSLTIDKAFNITIHNEHGSYFRDSMWSIFVRLCIENL